MRRGSASGAPSGRRTSLGAARRLVGTMLVLSSLVLLAYPAISSVMSSSGQDSAVTTVLSVADEAKNADRLALLAQARGYNARLASAAGMTWEDDSMGKGGGTGGTDDIAHEGASVPGDATGGELGYPEQLSWRQPGVMGEVEIPSIGTRLPIGHGTGEDVLSSGAGHLPTSSLPVGGLSSHCVISGHSGMGTARMFDDLGTLREGDVFLLRVLGDMYAYRVYSVEDMVEPDDLPGRCRIEEGRDLCTLFTCTPYGINSHRLLVHGERVPYDPGDSDLAWDGTRIYGNRLTWPFAMAVVLGAALAAVAAGGLVIRAKREASLTGGPRDAPSDSGRRP